MQSEKDLEASLFNHFGQNEAHSFKALNSIINNLIALGRHPNPAQAQRCWLSILATATDITPDYNEEYSHAIVNDIRKFAEDFYAKAAYNGDLEDISWTDAYWFIVKPSAANIPTPRNSKVPTTFTMNPKLIPELYDQLQEKSPKEFHIDPDDFKLAFSGLPLEEIPFKILQSLNIDGKWNQMSVCYLLHRLYEESLIALNGSETFVATCDNLTGFSKPTSSYRSEWQKGRETWSDAFIKQTDLISGIIYHLKGL